MPTKDALAGGIVGRDRELASADEFLDAGIERIALLELEGEPGIGKTILWREIVERARRRDYLVLSCGPAETETKLALSALADLLEPVPGSAFDTLPAPQRRALESALLRAEPEGAPAETRTLATAVRSLLAELAVDRPVLVAVDDVQWLDGASAAVLQFALRRLGDRRMAWLLATRPLATTSLDLDRVIPPEAITRIQLGPLSLAALHHVIEFHLDGELTRSRLVRVHGDSAGNPLFAIEVARELARGDRAPGDTMPTSHDLHGLLTGRLERLPPDTKEALLTASAMSDPTTAFVDVEALAPAEEAEIVRVDDAGRIRFRHPLLSSAVYEAAPRARRLDVHERLAELVSDPEERARHLAAAHEEPDEAVAEVVELGAGRARSRGAWESAAELLERAAALTPPQLVEAARRRRIAAAEHHVHAGDRRRGRVLLEELLAEMLSRAQRADALRLLAEICAHDENFVEAFRLFEQALEYADDPMVTIANEMGLAFTWAHVHLMDFETCSLHAHRALELAESAGDAGALAEALGSAAVYECLCGRGVDWSRVERALVLEDRSRVVPIQVRPSLIDPLLRLYVGQHAEARERLAALSAEASAKGDESDLAFVLLWRSWLESRAAELDTAATLAEEAATMARLTGSGSLEALALMQRAYVGACRGEIDGTRRACAEGLEAMARFGHSLMGLWIAASLALLELSLGNPKAAWGACEPIVLVLEREGIGEPVPLFFLPDALEALIALGELDRAEALLDELRARGRALDRIWALATEARCRALLLAARGDLPVAAAEVDRALAEHERIELPLELGRTLLAKGAIERRRRKRATAKASFDRALEIFDRIGAQLWVARARTELDRLGLRRTSGDELTESEQRVAELTALGMRRREVAAALFISPKTVDATLARVYRKFGIGTRAELGARMATLPKA